ncbi:unnamed protein product [Caenorhabditis brenneri]
MLKICVKEQQEQEDKLETVSQKIAEYKGNAVQGAKTVNTVIRNADLYREDSPLKNILLKLFWKESNSTREWRQALRDESYHSGHQDVGEIFEVLIEDLCKDINLNPMKFETTSETKCKLCGHSENSTTIQHFSILNLTKHETFKKLAEYLPAKKGRKGEEGHYVAWINTGVDWMCVNDNNNKFRRKDLDLSDMNVNLIAFEKVDHVKVLR